MCARMAIPDEVLWSGQEGAQHHMTEIKWMGAAQEVALQACISDLNLIWGVHGWPV